MESACLVVDVRDANSGIRVTFVAHFQSFLVFFIRVGQVSKIRQKAPFHAEKLRRKTVVSVTQMLSLSLFYVVNGSFQVSSSLCEISKSHVGICVARLLTNDGLKHL